MGRSIREGWHMHMAANRKFACLERFSPSGTDFVFCLAGTGKLQYCPGKKNCLCQTSALTGSMAITTSSFWPLWNPFAQNGADKCKKYWWTNLLFIQNIYPWRLLDECVGWTWYLAIDMQLFLVTPFVV